MQPSLSVTNYKVVLIRYYFNILKNKYISKIVLISLFTLNYSITIGQVEELDNFRKEITLFVNYDQNKIDTIKKTLETTKRLKANYENAFIKFIKFIKNKNSKNFDHLRLNSIDNKTSNTIVNKPYFLHTLKIEPLNKSIENNDYFHIIIYPIYDYGLPNFVSFYIQPIKIETKEYIVYYCKLNNIGTYYIKDVLSNEIIFKSEGLTSNTPIIKFSKIDTNHILFVEDLGDNGQRALVVNTKLKSWKAINGFKGKAFTKEFTNPIRKNEIEVRKYLYFISSSTIRSNYDKSYLAKFTISFDGKAKSISYKRYNKIETNIKSVVSKWKNNLFEMDDYYLGDDINDKPVPNPFKD